MEKEKKARSAVWKWLLGIAAALALLAAASYVVIFRVNQFSLSVEIAGEEEQLLEYGSSYEDPGAKVMLYGTLFLKDGMEMENTPIHIRNEIRKDKLGKYAVTYSAELEWLSASAQRIVRVVDRESPVITLVEPKEPLLAGTPYEEDGFTAVDNYDGDITDKVIRVESYGLVTYTVMDSSGNPAQVEREIPYYDPLPPEIVLEQGGHITIPVGTIFEDPGFTAIDNVDGNVTEQVEVTGEVIWYQPGTYELVYSVTDEHENNATVVRRVEVEAQPWTEIVTPDEKVVYLTFDDGPGPYTDLLLDILAKYEVKATFFVVDSGYDKVMKRIVDEGHSIGIHSVTHDYEEIYASPEAYFTDLHKMQDIIYENTGVRTTLMRFPGGSSNTVSHFSEGIMTLLTEAVQNAGFQYFDWNVDSNDAGLARKKNMVVDNVTEGLRWHPTAIVLQHDIHPFSVDAVEEIIRWALDNGFTFLPLQPDSPNAHHGVRN